MSTSIEFSRTIMSFKKDGFSDFYFGFTEGGASNCFDQDNKIARSDFLMYSGEHYKVMKKVIKVSGDFEGRCMKLGSGHCKPETYIAK